MQNNVLQAITCLQAGELVAFPTETVYGLGADATNENAIRKVFAIKGRPTSHPFIVHIAGIEQLEHWAINIPSAAKILANHFWPGPFTLILPKHPQVSKLITGGQDTIAIRIPKHLLTLTMLKQFNSGIVGPSANIYGRISPTTASHVQKDLGKKVAYILDGGPCAIGIESTIVHFIDNKIQILRQGSITKEDIYTVLDNKSINISEQISSMRIPGSTNSHYAPIKPLFLAQAKEISSIATLMVKQGLNYSYISFQPCPIVNQQTIWVQTDKQPTLYAKNLYSYLHQLDTTNTQGIIIEMPPSEPAWAAIIDRLTKASNGEVLSLARAALA